MRHRGQTEVLLGLGRVEELEVLVEDRLVLLEADDRFLFVGPRDGDGVRRGVDVRDRVLRFQRDVDGELVERRRRLAIGTQGVDVFDQAVVLVGDVLVLDRDLLIAPGRHREDLHPQEAGAEVFEQAGVVRTLDDVGVDLAGLIGFD